MEEPKFIRYKEIAVAGTAFENRSTYMRKMNMDTKITIKKEEDNPYDKDAIAVYAEIEKMGLKKIGYIPSKLCKTLAKKLEKSDLHHATICDISKQMMSTKSGFDTTYYSLTISLTFQTKEDLEVERERYLAGINYPENRFYFKNIFSEELGQQLEEMEVRMQQIAKKNYLLVSNSYMYSADAIINYAKCDDFLSHVGLVKDLLHQIDFEMVINLKNISCYLNTIYKGYPIRDSELASDLLFISNLDKEAVESMKDFNYYNDHFLKREIC